MASAMKKMTAVFMALVLACALTPSLAFATTDLAVGKADFSTSTNTITKKGKTIKAGTTNLTFKKGSGYLKFKAPSTKTYSFTFSKLKAKKSYSAYVTVQSMYDAAHEYAFSRFVTTAGGETSTLWLAVNGHADPGKNSVESRLNSRTAKIKLKKNEQLFFYFNAGTAKTTATLKVK